jgi:HSP20 family protein
MTHNPFPTMHTNIHPTSSHRRKRETDPASTDSVRIPCYDWRELPGAVKLVVFVPGVDASGVEIEGRRPDLVITARKTRFVRVNWQALHLEGSQRDYRLRLRLGGDFEFSAIQAEIGDGVLTVTVPKREGCLAPTHRLERVA